MTPFTRGAIPYLVACIDRQTVSCLLLQWTNGRFQNPQPLPLTGRASQVEIINIRGEDTLLLVVIEGDLSFLDITSMNAVYFAHLNNYCQSLCFDTSELVCEAKLTSLKVMRLSFQKTVVQRLHTYTEWESSALSLRCANRMVVFLQ